MCKFKGLLNINSIFAIFVSKDSEWPGTSGKLNLEIKLQKVKKNLLYSILTLEYVREDKTQF